MKRSLDHLVMPTADLAVARARLTALGFTVAPDGVHPFGTANCCVYFQNGTFLEPLAVRDASAAQEAISSQNMFVARDRLFRTAVSEEGISAAVFATDDAERDHHRFIELGVSAGPILEFSRPFVDASGASDEAVFRLAFAASPQSAASYFFTCQRVRAPKVDLGGLQRHPNGAVRPAHVTWNSADIGSALPFWRNLLESRPSGFVDPKLWFRLSNISFWIASDDVLARKYEVEPDGIEGDVRARSLQFECESMARLRRILDASGVDYYEKGFRLFVPAAPGQGVPFIFLGNRP